MPKVSRDWALLLSPLLGSFIFVLLIAAMDFEAPDGLSDFVLVTLKATALAILFGLPVGCLLEGFLKKVQRTSAFYYVLIGSLAGQPVPLFFTVLMLPSDLQKLNASHFDLMLLVALWGSICGFLFWLFQRPSKIARTQAR